MELLIRLGAPQSQQWDAGRIVVENMPFPGNPKHGVRVLVRKFCQIGDNLLVLFPFGNFLNESRVGFRKFGGSFYHPLLQLRLSFAQGGFDSFAFRNLFY